MLPSTLYAQTAIATINTTTVSGTSTSNLNVVIPSDAGNSLADDASEEITVNYGQGNNVRVSSYVVSGTTYDRFLAPDTLVLNRATASDRLVNIWLTLTNTIVDNTPPTDNVANLDADEVDDADAIYLSGNFNAGYDNILVNIDDAASGSIEVETERVDVIWYSGIQTSDPTTAVFPIIERGGNDNIAVAAITSLNSDGTPASYGTLIGISENSWTGSGTSFNNYLILRRETAGSTPLPLLNIGTDVGQSAQTILGVAVSFSELGVAANTAVFGYSIFSADVVSGYVSNSGSAVATGARTIASGVDLTDISTFPNDTRSNDSGLDLVAGVAAAVASDDNLIETKGPGGYKAALSTWLKANEADDITTSTDGSGVLDWQDHWIGNHDATVGAAQPIYRSTSSSINFNPTVDFDGDKSLTIANNTDFNTATSYAKKGINLAFRTNTSNVTDRQVLYEQGGETRGINIYVRSGNLHISSWNRNNDGTGSPWNNGTNVSTVSTSVSADTEYIVTLELDGNSGVSGTLTGYLNGTSFGSISSVGLLFNDTDGIEFGGTDGTTQYDDGVNASTAYFRGEISELIYCNEPTAFSTAQRDRIESYLAIKYGITLDQSTPNDYVNSGGTVIFDATNNASLGGFLEYNNDIAGIGRDDDSELDQPKSRSENSDGIVIIDRGATIGTNDAWLIWGNDNAALTETELLTKPDTIDRRLNRVWRVSEEKEVQTTSVSFDITGLGLSTDQSDFSLLIAGSGTAADFSSATVVSGGTLSGNIITFTGVDLEDGQYFTLGTNFFECSPGGIEDNLTLWLRADDGTNTTVNGAEVTSWTNQGGSSTVTGTGGTSPTFVENDMNFNPALDFDGTEFLEGSAGLNSTGYYMVINPDNEISSVSSLEVPLGFDVSSSGATSNLGLFGLGNTLTGDNERVTHLIGLGGTEYGRSEDDAGKSTVAGTALLYHVRDNAGGTAATISENGEQIDNFDIRGSFLSFTNEEFEIGRLEQPNDITANTFNFNGQIAELISYSVRPTDAENERIESYLSIKYGITLDNSGGGTDGDYTSGQNTTIWDASDYSTYHNDVAGIGRDDVSCFQQKQSKSSNSGSLVTIGLGGIEATNAANANTFSTDDTYMVWGNDGDFTDKLNANTSDVPGVVTERMERIWRVNETNTVGATTVQFDITGLGYSTNASDFNLITSSTATMASGSVTPAASLVGNILTFTGVDFADGDFFTIGTARTTCSPGGVSGIVEVWFRADAGTSTTTDNTTLSTWTDQSGSGNDGTSDGNPPLFKNNATDNINFNPTLEFDGTDDRLATQLDGIKGTNYTLLAVGERGDANASNYVLGGARNSPPPNEVLHFGYRDNATATLAQFGNDIDVTVSLFDSPTAPFLLFGEVDGSGRVIEETRDNGFARNTNTNTDQLINNVQDYVANFGATYYGGKISEVVALNSDVTPLQKQQVTSYLALKYGITLTNDNDNDATLNETISGSVTEGDYVASDGTTIIWDHSVNSTYHNDVAGIGRDDDGCFIQKQSTAQDTDDILTIGLGSIATTNTLNANGFDMNKDYLVWGNDDASTLPADVITDAAQKPNSISERMARIWKVQDTGEVGETELQFDVTGYDVSDPTAFSLLVNGTADMSTATIISGGTLNGNILSFTGVNLTDGQFFTIGTGITICGPGGVNSNIALWLKGDLDVFSDAGSTAAVDGNTVQQWNDQSSTSDNGSRSDLSGGGPIPPTFETNEINFHPALNFTDPNSTNASYIETSANTVSGDMTLISVFQTGQSAGSANDFVNSPALIGASETTSDLDYGLGMENGSIWVHANSTAADVTFDAETSNTFNNNQPHFVTATRTQSSGTITIYVDANSEATGTGSTTALTAPTSFGVGNHSDGDVDAQYAGLIAETIVFSKVLDSDERNKVESYLALKYGLTMNASDDGATGMVDERDYRASDGDPIWDFDDQGATYYNDIFGIGKDDPSCFEQTTSKSESSDALVTLTLPGGSFSTDDSFLISGNDNAAIEATRNPERPATIDSRLNREWKVQETGTVGTVELTFDLSTITGTPLGSNNLTQTRLMVDDDGDFSNGGTTLISPSATNGGSNTVTFEVDFTSDLYYTLGSIESDALPITLISFEANTYKEDQVKLDWVTASEVNNAFYSIERSTDGINFETIANLDGAGNSNALLYYTYVDTKPISGTSFYRLKQTDFSGEFDYSEIRSVKVERQFEASFKAFPNPIRLGDELKISYSLERAQTLRLSVLNTRGQIVTRESRGVLTPEGFIEISTDQMSRGLNLIRILDESGHTVTLKVIVR